MFTHAINPILLDFGILQIRWYGLMYVIAFILAYYIILKIAKDFDLELSKDDVSELLLFLAIGMIIFARLVEVVYYNPSYYFSNPSTIIAVWQGGLSFHGGLLGVVIGAWLWAKKKNIPFLKLADVIAIPGALGLMFGRIGNFINGELVGRVTDVSWCFNFQGYEGCRHPSQLYEAFKNLLIFGMLWPLKGKKPDGFIFFFALILYAIFRSIIEAFWREPQAYILGFTQGQFLNIFVLIAGVIGIWWVSNTHKPLVPS